MSSLLLLLSLSFAAPAFAEDNSFSGEVRSQQDFMMLFDEVDVAQLDDVMPELDSKQPYANLIGYWRCDAWPTTYLGYNYYWLHTNVNVARANALNACVANFGFVCNYWCRFGY